MVGITRGRRARKRPTNAVESEPPPKSPKAKVNLLSPSSLLLLQIPTETNTSGPVWDALKSQQVSAVWTVSPHNITVSVTPAAFNQIKSEGTSTPPQTEVCIHSVSRGGEPKSPCAALASPRSSTEASSSTQVQPLLSLAPASSYIVILPAVITPAQSTPHPSPPPDANQAQQPDIQSSTVATPESQQAPPVLHFHTKSASEVKICDNFLISTCPAGEECPMHHTKYPFHWQLRSVSTHEWIDVPPHVQIWLEKKYCDVSQTKVYISDGDEFYTLNLESMQLKNRAKYDAVRRLVNSDNPDKNPHFPAKLLIYWWDNYSWTQYNKKTSEYLLRMQQEVKECSFRIGLKLYIVNFKTMKQTNVKTGFMRSICCRPQYSSPDFMQPYLKTITQEDPGSEPPAANFSEDALKGFTSWYPPVWVFAPEQDYSLVDVPAGTEAYRSIISPFFESIPETSVEIISVQQVQNLFHWDMYQRHKMFMMKKYPESEAPLEKHLFHGTSEDAVEAICRNNFDPRLAGVVNGTSSGWGTYFAVSASLSDNYATKSGTDQLCHMFLAKVLVGKSSRGKSSYRRPPELKPSPMQCALYDSCVDNLTRPTMFVVFDSCQCYPAYLIKYRHMANAVALS